MARRSKRRNGTVPAGPKDASAEAAPRSSQTTKNDTVLGSQGSHGQAHARAHEYRQHARLAEVATDVRSEFLSAARQFRDILTHPKVAAHWNDPSAVAAFDIGDIVALGVGLTRRAVAVLEEPISVERGRQKVSAGQLLADELRTGELLAGEVGDVAQSSRTQRPVREIVDLVAAVSTSVIELMTGCASAPVDREIVVGERWRIRYDDFLAVLLAKLYAYCDDLAVAIGTPRLTLAPPVLEALSMLCWESTRHVVSDGGVVIATMRPDRDRNVRLSDSC